MTFTTPGDSSAEWFSIVGPTTTPPEGDIPNMTGATKKLIVPAELERSHGGLRHDGEVDDSATFLLDKLVEYLGADDLAALALLDVGCGIKFTRALINHEIPVGSYFGVDVYKPVIEFLRDNVVDDRFAYAHFDVHNERYNPDGRRMSDTGAFPVGDSRFDVALGYSLFTHLDPGDAEITLRNMRSAIANGGRAVFTIFLDEHSESGLGWVDQYSKALGDSVAGTADGGFADVFLSLIHI